MAAADRTAHKKLKEAQESLSQAEANLAAHHEARLLKVATHQHGAKVRTARSKVTATKAATEAALTEVATLATAAEKERATFPQQMEEAQTAEAACVAAVSALQIDIAANKDALTRAKDKQKEASKRAKQADKDKEVLEKSGEEETSEAAGARQALKVDLEKCAEVVTKLTEKQVDFDAREKVAKKALVDATKAVAAIPARAKELEKEEAATEAKHQKAVHEQQRAEAKLDELLEEGPKVKGRRRGAHGNKASINEGPDVVRESVEGAGGDDDDNGITKEAKKDGDAGEHDKGGKEQGADDARQSVDRESFDREDDDDNDAPTHRRFSVVQKEALRALYPEYGTGEDDEAGAQRRAEDEAAALLLIDSARPGLEEQVTMAKAALVAAKSSVASVEADAAAAQAGDLEANKKVSKAKKAIEVAEAKIEAATARVAEMAENKLKVSAQRDALLARRQALGYEARLTGAGEARRQLARKLERTTLKLKACRSKADQLQEKLTDFNLEVRTHGDYNNALRHKLPPLLFPYTSYCSASCHDLIKNKAFISILILKQLQHHHFRCPPTVTWQPPSSTSAKKPWIYGKRPKTPLRRGLPWCGASGTPKTTLSAGASPAGTAKRTTTMRMFMVTVLTRMTTPTTTRGPAATAAASATGGGAARGAPKKTTGRSLTGGSWKSSSAKKTGRCGTTDGTNCGAPGEWWQGWSPRPRLRGWRCSA